MATISPNKQRLIRAALPIAAALGLTESDLRRLSEEKLQTMVDNAPASAGGGTDVSSGLVPCSFCTDGTQVPTDKLTQHIVEKHPDKMGAAATPPAASAAGTGTAATGGSSTPQPVDPNQFKNDHWRDAKADLEDAGYEVTRERRHSPDVAEDRVISAEVTGTKAKLIVSDGPDPAASTPAAKPPKPKVTMPGFVGKKLADVENDVENDVFKGKYRRGTDTEGKDLSKADGEILAQQPEPGEHEIGADGNPPELRFRVNRLTAEEAAAAPSTPTANQVGDTFRKALKGITSITKNL